MASNQEDQVALPLLAIAGSVCWECKEYKPDGTALSRCTGCKRAVYCSSKCQKRNWASEHNTLCKALKRLNAGPKANGKLTWNEFKNLQLQRHRMIVDMDEEGFQKPEATNHARAVMNQPKCENCLRTPFDDVDPDTFRLQPCEECRLAFYCSPDCLAEGSEQHRSKQCASLKEAGACELIRVKHTKETGETMVQLPTESPRDTYRPLHTAHNWKEYFEDFSESLLATFIDKDFSPAGDDAMSLRVCRLLKVAVDTSSLILTILAGLESEIPDLASRTKLTIHVVGADDQELRRARMTEELYHLLPNLQALVIGYVGPDVGQSHGDTKKLVDFDCCPKCHQKNRAPRQVFMANDLYHDFVDSELFAKHPPDLIVAFQSGHAQFSSWQPTLESILDLGVPAVFTTYNKQEALDEEQSFDEMGAHFSRRPAENPWRGVLPNFDVFVGRYDVFYCNYYWYIVKGRISDGVHS